MKRRSPVRESHIISLLKLIPVAIVILHVSSLVHSPVQMSGMHQCAASREHAAGVSAACACEQPGMPVGMEGESCATPDDYYMALHLQSHARNAAISTNVISYEAYGLPSHRNPPYIPPEPVRVSGNRVREKQCL